VVAAHEREDVKRALRFEKLVRESRARGISGGAFGKAQDAALGMLAALQGNNVGARKHFAEARPSLEREGLLCFGAIIDFQDARVVGAMGNIEGWRAALERAHRQFDALGMVFWKDRAAKALASSAPAEARNPHALGPDGLSRREVEILGLLAAGGTAKTIASRLALSVATVNRHVANIYQKIGVNSRAAATVYALKHGIGKDVLAIARAPVYTPFA
jgi:DNA-binding CsgD family transcriptional regulator